MKRNHRQIFKIIWIIIWLLLSLRFDGNAIASEPQPAACAEIYVVQANDWLSLIADKFYGNIEAYTAIVAATNRQHQADPSFALIANPDVIEVGWKLCVPVTGEAELLLSGTLPAPVDELPPAVMPPLTTERYTLDNFVNEHIFSREVQSQWIYSSPETVKKYEVLPEHQKNNDTYGYRANYLWNEHLPDDYFENPNLFKKIPPQIKTFAAPWGNELPRYRYPPHVTLPTGLTTNQFGWRGPDITLDKPPQTVRIAAVGASTTVGTHNHPFSYPELLEHWLNVWSESNGYDVNFEVINTGREGLNSPDIATVVRTEVLPMDVDYVIYYEGSNQFHPETVVSFPPEHTLGKPPAGIVPNLNNVDSDDKNLLDFLSEHSALAARARNIVEQFLLTGHEPPKPEQTFYLPQGLDEFSPDRAQLGNVLALGRILNDLDNIKQTLDSSDTKMVMTTFNWFVYDRMVLDPSRHRNLYVYINRLYWPISYANMRRAADFQNRVFKRWAADNRVPIIDVAGSIPTQPDLYDDAIHNTYLGARIRAWIMFEALVPLLKQDIENEVLPRPAMLKYKQHPYIKPEYDIRTLSN
jgi:hypothetical protein